MFDITPSTADKMKKKMFGFGAIPTGGFGGMATNVIDSPAGDGFGPLASKFGLKNIKDAAG